ncbi:type III-B CRISPR module-associated protein Cmr5 [Corallococcus sp. H22C18031201]|nr:type III-B CRISPR module-associated protein Cmr5 [Corallococcus sp. H22C18031201]
MKGLTRDQFRAAFAYRCVDAVDVKLRDDYKTRVNSLGSSVMRDGLATALMFLARDSKDAAAKLLLEQLALPEVLGPSARADLELVRLVCELQSSEYMRVTREVLAMAVWLRRAVSATFVAESEAADVAHPS